MEKMILASVIYGISLLAAIRLRQSTSAEKRRQVVEIIIGFLVVIWITSMFLIYLTESTIVTRYEGTYELVEKTTTVDRKYAFVLENERGVRTMVESIGKQMFFQYEEGEQLYCSFEGTTHKYDIIPSELNGDDVTYDNLLVYSSTKEEKE